MHHSSQYITSFHYGTSLKVQGLKNRDMAGTWWEIPGWKLSRFMCGARPPCPCKTPSLLLLGTMWPILLLILSNASWSLALTHGSHLRPLSASGTAGCQPQAATNVQHSILPSTIIHHHPPSSIIIHHIPPSLWSTSAPNSPGAPPSTLLLSLSQPCPGLVATPKQPWSTCTSICRFMSRRPIWHMDLLDTFGLWKKKVRKSSHENLLTLHQVHCL